MKRKEDVFLSFINKQTGHLLKLQMIRHFRMCKIVDDLTILAINIY